MVQTTIRLAMVIIRIRINVNLSLIFAKGYAKLSLTFFVTFHALNLNRRIRDL